MIKSAQNILLKLIKGKKQLLMEENDDYSQLHVDFYISSNKNSILLSGWLWHKDSEFQSLGIVTDSSKKKYISKDILFFKRQDVVEYLDLQNDRSQINVQGFYAYIILPEFSEIKYIECVLKDNTYFSNQLEDATKITESLDGIKAALSLYDANGNDVGTQGIVDIHNIIEPMLSDLHDTFNSDDITPIEHLMGNVPLNPDVSVIVPVYGNLEFMEHQLLQFSDDPDFRNVELIYVIDDPNLAESSVITARRLSLHYEIPIKLLILPRNFGFSCANNIGAGNANGRLLILLNSDVVPVSPGWVTRMSGFYDNQNNIGAMGVKLIYEDKSIQHAGGYFKKDLIKNDEVWYNDHYFKGMHADTPAANISKRVPFVTAACLMINKETYLKAGGLCEDYIIANFEDSDFCLQLITKGLENWYFSDVELYHFEGVTQSLPGNQWLHNAYEYNRRLHTKIWSTLIQTTMEQYVAEDSI